MSLSFQILSLVIINGFTGVLFFKYFIQEQKQDNDKNDKLLWLLEKITTLEITVNELNTTIDNLDLKLQVFQDKENNLQESTELLFNKLDKYIISNYDTIQH